MERPRLLFAGQTLAALREKLKDPAVAPLAARFRAKADWWVSRPEISPPPVASTQMDRSPGELMKSRAAQGCIVTCGLAYLLTGEARYLDRAGTELDCWLGRWESWTDPYHGDKDFFDLMTGEMGLTMGLAYDWLKDALPPERAARLREALGRRIVDLYLKNTDPPKPAWWYGEYHNWNTVCNGGAVIAALALGDEHPRTADVLARARASWGLFYDALGTEGGWDEGTGYWQYGMRYAIMALAALRERGLPDDGLLERPGTKLNAYFPISFCPGGVPVSWGDSGSPVSDPIFYWLGAHYRNPDYVAYLDRRLEGAGGHEAGWPEEAFAVLWRPAGEAWLPKPGAPLTIGTARLYREIGWSVFTDSWEAPAFIAGFKCGDLAANHTHLDNNTFQIWAKGAWLADDLGGGVYNADYFSEKRWSMYVVATQGHNGLLIGGRGQVEHTKGRLAWGLRTKDLDEVIGDASANYGPGVTRAIRHFAVVRRSYVVVLDDVETADEQPLTWLLHARKHLEIEGETARVLGHEERLFVAFPPGAATLSATQGPGSGASKKEDWVLTAAIPAARTHVLPVVLVPVPPHGAAKPTVTFHLGPDRCEIMVRIAGAPEETLIWIRQPDGWRLSPSR